jgi:hypothetical protein
MFDWPSNYTTLGISFGASANPIPFPLLSASPSYGLFVYIYCIKLCNTKLRRHHDQHNNCKISRIIIILKLGCLHHVACIRLGSGVSVKRNSVSIVVLYPADGDGIPEVSRTETDLWGLMVHIRINIQVDSKS